MDYAFLKFLHVVAAVVAVGANLTYVVWLHAAGRDPDRLAFTITTIRRIDRRVANPGYVALLVTGLLMVWVGPWELFDPDALWLTVALGLYAATAILGIAVFAPTLRRRLAAAGSDPTSEVHAALARRTDLLFALTTGVVLAILALMVMKPF